jgi:hypothetical protein
LGLPKLPGWPKVMIAMGYWRLPTWPALSERQTTSASGKLRGSAAVFNRQFLAIMAILGFRKRSVVARHDS